jgi:hypothetical protein
MPKFDHRFDNQVQNKKDLRFTTQEDAEDYAVGQYSMYFSPQVVYMTASELYAVREEGDEEAEQFCTSGELPGPGGQDLWFEVARINSMPGEG